MIKEDMDSNVALTRKERKELVLDLYYNRHKTFRRITKFTTSFSGNCMQTAAGSGEAIGMISAGQQLTCTITNTAVPTTGTLVVNKVCVTSAGGGSCQSSFNVQVAGTNPQPTSFSLGNGGSQSVILGAGAFTVSEDSVSGFTTSFSGDCMQSSSSGSQEATGTIAAGQQKTCTITNTAVPAPATATLTVKKRLYKLSY